MKILRILTRPNLGGPTRQAIALWHAHQAQSVETLLVTGVVGDEEVELSPAEHGVPVVTRAQLRSGWLALPMLRRGLDPLGDRRARTALRELIRAYRPDVVHTHTSKAGWVGRRAVLAERGGARAPVLAHTFHGHVLQDYFGRLPSLMLRRLERRLARQTDLLFAVSPSCADELAAGRVAARERFDVVPPAVALLDDPFERVAARQQLAIESQQWRVCAVGRLVPIKRLGDFVTTIAALPDLHGDLFGGGPDREALQQLASQQAAGRVALRGAEPNIARLLSAYDAVVLPSVREGCPLVAIEAFAAGVPVVGYDVPGVRDALQEFGRGVLVPERDGPGGLANALQKLREDPVRRAALVTAARGAVALCRPEVVARQLFDAYGRVIR